MEEAILPNLRHRINNKEKKLLDDAFINYMNHIPIDFDVLITRLNEVSDDHGHWDKEKVQKWFYNSKSRSTSPEKIKLLTAENQQEIEDIKKHTPETLMFSKSILQRRNIKKTNSGIHVYYSCKKCHCNITFEVMENWILRPIETSKHETCLSKEEETSTYDQFLRIEMLAKAEEKVQEGDVKGPRGLLNTLIYDKSIKASNQKKIAAITLNDCKRIISENTEKVTKVADVTIPEKAAIVQCGGTSIQFLKFHVLYPCIYIGFCCRKQEDLLRESSNLFIDGTFKERPKEFRDQKGQLLNFLIWDPVTNIYIPVLHVLMNGRKEFDYFTLFKIIDVFLDTKKVIDIYIDFEGSLSNSIKNWKPDATIHKCFFHYTQCLVRKMKELYHAYDSPTGKLLLKILKQLPFFDIAMRIIFIMKMRDINSIELNQMLEYYVGNWLYEYLILDYSPNEPLTNNGCETFHSELSHLIKNTVPSLEELSISLFSIFEAKSALRASYTLPQAPTRRAKNFIPLGVKDIMDAIEKLPLKIKTKGGLRCKYIPKETKKLNSLVPPIF